MKHLKKLLSRLKALPLTTHLKVHIITLFAGVFIGLVSSQFNVNDELNFGMWLGLILMLAGMLWGPVFLRCPHCGCWLGRRHGIPNFCPSCGKKLD